jgi:hypothetical protein
LKDKIPDELLTDSNIVLRLSQDDKLFKIENKNSAPITYQRKLAV